MAVGMMCSKYTLLVVAIASLQKNWFSGHASEQNLGISYATCTRVAR